MTLSELDSWRAKVPFYVCLLCTAPWILVQFDPTKAKWAQAVVVYPLAIAWAYLYHEIGVRNKFWRREIDSHIGQQIRATLLGLVPKDLEITSSEAKLLAEWELFKDLTGVFWEAVERDEQLRKLKDHFYSNGLRYTTAIDVSVITALAALVYFVFSYVTADGWYLLSALLMFLISMLSTLVFVPRRRARHLRLSKEQLDLLRRTQKDFVIERIREIILNWRRIGVLGQ